MMDTRNWNCSCTFISVPISPNQTQTKQKRTLALFHATLCDTMAFLAVDTARLEVV